MVPTTYLYKSRLCHPKCQIYMARYIPYGNIKCFQAIGKVLKYFTFHQIIKNHEDQKGYRITQYYIITALINSTMCKVVYIIRCYVHQKISFSYFYYKTPGTHGEGPDKQLRIECQFVILYYHVQKLRQKDLYAGIEILYATYYFIYSIYTGRMPNIFMMAFSNGLCAYG